MVVRPVSRDFSSSLQRARSLFLVACVSLLGCGGGNDASDSAAMSGADSAAEGEPADEATTEAAPDSLPMELTISVAAGPKLSRSLKNPGGSKFDGGPFTVRGNGTQ